MACSRFQKVPVGTSFCRKVPQASAFWRNLGRFGVAMSVGFRRFRASHVWSLKKTVVAHPQCLSRRHMRALCDPRNLYAWSQLPEASCDAGMDCDELACCLRRYQVQLDLQVHGANNSFGLFDVARPMPTSIFSFACSCSWESVFVRISQQLSCTGIARPSNCKRSRAVGGRRVIETVRSLYFFGCGCVCGRRSRVNKSTAALNWCNVAQFSPNCLFS